MELLKGGALGVLGLTATQAWWVDSISCGVRQQRMTCLAVKGCGQAAWSRGNLWAAAEQVHVVFCACFGCRTVQEGHSVLVFCATVAGELSLLAPVPVLDAMQSQHAHAANDTKVVCQSRPCMRPVPAYPCKWV